MPEDSTELTDIYVVLPGILGSTLYKDGNPIWEPSPGAAWQAIKSLGASLKDMKLPDNIGDDAPNDGVKARGLMPDVHVIPGLWTANIGYSKLTTRLRSIVRSATGNDANIIEFPYDWRLSNRYNAKILKATVERALERWRAQGGPYVGAKLVFICHSMGGLVARWYIQEEGGHEVTRKLITMGTPYRGATNAIDGLVNGSQKGWGPFKVDLTAVARSMPSMHQLLPEYACVSDGKKLLKTTETMLPNVDGAMVTDAMAFLTTLNEVPLGALGVDVHPIAGTQQPTKTTAEIIDSRAVFSTSIEGNDERGDSTVPSLSAMPKGVPPDSNIIRRVAESHGSLQSNQAVLDEIEGVITASRIIHRGPQQFELGVSVDSEIGPGEMAFVEVDCYQARQVVAKSPNLEVVARSESGRIVGQAALSGAGRTVSSDLGPLPAGVHTLTVQGANAMLRTQVAPVTRHLVAWDDE